MRLLIAAAAALALAGCTTSSDLNQTAQKTLGYACPALQTAYVGVQAYQAAGGKISAKDAATIEAAYQPAAAICADPSKATVADAAVLVLNEAAVITKIMKKKAG